MCRDVHTVLSVAAVTMFAGVSSPLAAAEPTVIELTQVACQFLEPENGLNHEFTSSRKADCDAINERTAEDRLAKANTLTLASGSYVFRVTNSNVPYDLGFWLRGASLIDRALLPSVSGGGLKLGATMDYAIELEPGEYLYSCPLNTTPDYRLVVTE
ncbi:MAG: hypothetical protein WD673_08035 [Alphaproteobacteria bacterium]